MYLCTKVLFLSCFHDQTDVVLYFYTDLYCYNVDRISGHSLQRAPSSWLPIESIDPKQPRALMCLNCVHQRIIIISFIRFTRCCLMCCVCQRLCVVSKWNTHSLLSLRCIVLSTFLTETSVKVFCVSHYWVWKSQRRSLKRSPPYRAVIKLRFTDLKTTCGRSINIRPNRNNTTERYKQHI